MTDVAPGSSLLDWVTGLVTDPTTQARFAADPHGVLGEAGLADLDPADLHHAIPLVTDCVAARLDAVVDRSSPVPGLLAGESGLDAAVRQFAAIAHRLVPLDDPDPVHSQHDLHDASAGFDAEFDDVADHHDLRDVHDLDDRAHDAWSVHHPADTAADHARPVPAFATGHESPVGEVDADHTTHADPAGPDTSGHGTSWHDTSWHDTSWHDDATWHDDAPHGLAHGSPDEGDHRLDEDALHHTDHTDSHHDPGAALGAS